MYSKINFLLKQYFNLIKETPDWTINPESGEPIQWNKEGARAFGFLSLIQERKAKQWRRSDMKDFPNNFISFKGFPAEFNNKLYVGDNTNEIHEDLLSNRAAKDIENANQGIITITIRNGEDTYVYDLAKANEKDKDTIRFFLVEGGFNPREILEPAGRIWPDQKIISFWCKEGEVTPEHLDMVFASLKIPKQEADMFYIEFIEDEKPSKKVHDYTSRGAIKKELSDEEEKRAAEALAKAHGAAAIGTKNSAVQDILKTRKQAGIQADARARASGKIPDLRTRQMAQTSESLQSFKNFFNKTS